MRYAFIRAHERIFPVRTMCRVLDVSRSGYYAAQQRRMSSRAQQDLQLRVQIRSIHAESKKRYGSPRIHSELRCRGIRCARKRVERLMRTDGVRARKKRSFVVTTQADAQPPVANLLKRRFTVSDQMDSTWVADLTYLPTQQGWLYLAVLIDLATRAVVGWATDHRLKSGLAVRALQMALDRQSERPVLHHSDQGSQYNSIEYRSMLANHGITASMSRKGDCWDNAVAESFFATLKWELVADAFWRSRSEARGAIFEFIEVWYNRQRRHSSLGYVSPADFARTRSLMKRAA